MTILLDNLCFAEGPRWHNGQAVVFRHARPTRLHRHTRREENHPIDSCQDDEPSGLGWLPNGDSVSGFNEKTTNPAL